MKTEALLETAELHELDVAAPGWRDGIPADLENMKKHPSILELEQKDALLETLNEVAAFIDTHDCLPASLLEPAERRLRMWLSNCRQNYRDGRLALERAKLLDELLPGWRTTDPKKHSPQQGASRRRWEVRLAVLVTFCNEFGRFPNGTGASAR